MNAEGTAPMSDKKDLCAICGHTRYYHPRERDGKQEKFPCCFDVGSFQFCKCKNFVEAVQTQNEDGEQVMAKAKKEKAPKAPRVKKELGRKPTLAPFVDAPFKLYGTGANKDVTAQVLSSGIIVLEGKEYTSPSDAAHSLTKVAVNGWRFWQYNKNDKRVSLDQIRGSKSPLAEPKEKTAAV